MKVHDVCSFSDILLHQKWLFRFEKGPIFANLVLADEINRATPMLDKQDILDFENVRFVFPFNIQQPEITMACCNMKVFRKRLLNI